MFTAIAIMQLVEQGRLMRGAIPWDADAAAILEMAAGTALEFEPGTMFHYSNTGYLLPGLIIEDLYERSYSEVVTERIFQPLGMTQTVHDQSDLRARIANYYTEAGDVIVGDTLRRTTSSSDHC
jgi:CubicO group peptidase (beta-lactamase class C family)